MTQPNGGSGKARPVSDKAYETLYNAIVRCELAPGSWVKASDLSESLGVGRTPTIQALMRLESAGFTRPVKRKGWQITPITLQSVHDVFEAFRFIAPGLATLVVRNATDEQLRTLCELIESWAPSRTAPDTEPDFTVAPITYFVEICGNPVMTDMGRRMASHFEQVSNFGLQHGEFRDPVYLRRLKASLDTLVARDEKRAREAIVKLLEVSESGLSRVLKDTDSIRSTPIEMERVS